MDKDALQIQASTPVTLPRANPTISYWQDPPADIADLMSTPELPKSADVVIIGSGITGACIAYNLLEKNANLSIVMLEARQACSGATGRNGGHTKGASYRSFLDNKNSLGLQEAIKIARLEYNNIKEVHEFSRQYGIDCDLNSGDTVDIIYDEASWTQAHKAVDLMRSTMPDDLDGAAKYTFHTYEQAREKFHVHGEKFVGAIEYKAGSLSAYKLVIGILKLCLAKGLSLQTNTPAEDLVNSELPTWTVRTERGDIKTEKVVLATNGYTGRIYSRFHDAIVPLRGQITAHRPGQNMPVGGLETTYSFIYAGGYEYMIPRPKGSTFEGDIVIGGGLTKAAEEGLYEYGNTDDTTLNPEISKYLTATTPRYFGDSWGKDHDEGRIRKEWTGIMGYSPDGFPLVGPVPSAEGLWVSASFQGHGMVLCFMCARALVEMMMGVDKRLSDWFPDAFKISEPRMRMRFRGRLHTKPAQELELRAQG